MMLSLSRRAFVRRGVVRTAAALSSLPHPPSAPPTSPTENVARGSSRIGATARRAAVAVADPGAASPPSSSRRSFFSSAPSTSEGDASADAPPPPDAPAGDAKPPFDKVLIANRGEIALRVIRTCRSMGIKSVAVHSTVDRRSPHVLEADEAVCIGPAASSDSYLSIDNVIDAMVRTGAKAVHPGYGFLSENAEFARRVREAGASFVGPSASAIVAMGDKIQSKKLAREAGVSVIPGYDGIIKSPEEAVKIAEDIGYPVMIKASAGGGGKGMRVCRNPEEVVEGYHLSTAEASSFFGDDRLFVEKFVENPHHIEFQVLAGRRKLKGPKKIPAMNPFPILDGKEYGELEILVFPERECSIQRRNQKIIEESPSVLLTEETRAEMVRQVKALVRKVEYHSAGTVEFLVDEDQNFFFLEMNTRLQVEHPVTEMVTGNIDLVRGMLEVAAGWGVPDDYLALIGKGKSAKVSDDAEGDGSMSSDTDEEGKVVPHKGHAIEARIYAEDPFRGFLPSIGPLLQYAEPPATSQAAGGGTCTIRVDSGVRAGTVISQYYDPMISKLVAYSPDSRTGAIAALSDALDRYVIRGVGHNASFASDVLRHPAFQEGRTPTDYIPTHYPDGFAGVSLTDEEREDMAAIGALVGRERRRALGSPPLNGEGEDGEVVVCLGGMFGDAYRVTPSDVGGSRFVVERVVNPDIEGEGEADSSPMPIPRSVVVSFSDSTFDPAATVLELSVNGCTRAVQAGREDNVGVFTTRMFGADVDILIMSPREYELSRRMKEPEGADTSDLVLSPMPGTLISYAVEDGESVEAGQEICIVEAMKMQNVIRSSRAGVVLLKAEVGSSLHTDEIIAEFVSEEEEGTLTA